MQTSRFPLRPTLAALIVLLLILMTSDARAVNRFKIGNQTVPCGTNGVVLSVLADVDQDTYGLSLSIGYDPAEVRITGVALGAAITAIGPEWEGGVFDNSTGRLFHGIVFDLSGPTISKNLTAGADREVLRLTVDVVAPSPMTATLDLRDFSGTPSHLNVMTDVNGDSVAPAPTLVDGTITCRDFSARIDSVSDGEGGRPSGPPGTQFFVVGENFDQAGLEVYVGPAPAQDFSVVDAENLLVTSPNCSLGLLTVDVCNDFGCNAEPNAFECTGPPVPVIESFPEGNSGREGDSLLIVGQNFDQPNLTVEICDNPAVITQSDATQITVTAPACGAEGCVAVQVCTDIGCDRREGIAGFCYPSSPVIRDFPNGNSGVSGDTLFIVGENFDEPGRVVTICGEVAQHTFTPPDTLVVTVPDCDVGGCVPVEVCTDVGCDRREGVEGFCYPLAPVITGYPDGNEGLAGDTFSIVGENFGETGLEVTVCGVEAERSFNGVDTITVTLPECGTEGCVEVKVCTAGGCVVDDDGFCYLPVGVPFKRADANHDGFVDITDAIALFSDLFLGVPAASPCLEALNADGSGDIVITDGIYILTFLFQGGADPPPPGPFECGIDPDTPDCERYDSC